MVWLGAQTLRQVKIIDKNNFIEYIETSGQKLDFVSGRRSSPQFLSSWQCIYLSTEQCVFRLYQSETLEPHIRTFGWASKMIPLQIQFTPRKSRVRPSAAFS